MRERKKKKSYDSNSARTIDINYCRKRKKKNLFHTNRQDGIIYFSYFHDQYFILAFFILESEDENKGESKERRSIHTVRDNIIMKQRSMLFSLELAFVISGKHFGIWFVKREFEPRVEAEITGRKNSYESIWLNFFFFSFFLLQWLLTNGLLIERKRSSFLNRCNAAHDRVELDSCIRGKVDKHLSGTY